MVTATLRLKKNAERRLLGGHLWIYSNEVAVAQTPLHAFTPGQQAVIEAHNGKPVGCGYVNPHSLICARLISRNPAETLDKKLLSERLTRALQLRQRFFPQPFYRLVFGDSDYLPGLIVDRYNDVLVVQITTAGMEAVKEELKAALLEVLQPQAILLRNDSGIRELEGLPRYVEPLFGEPPQQVAIEENNARFLAPIWQGQKTGWFYDHRFNRARLRDYVAGKRVLDVFSYCGAWGVQAARFGASEVTCIDSSAQALVWLTENAELNKVSNKVKTINDDAFVALTQLHAAKEQFDVIILDPPAFIKRRKDLTEGVNAYHRLNQLALRLLSPDGILISASCSLHLQHDDLLNILRAAASRNNRELQILEQGHQALDHPLHPAIAETNYLKAFFCRA